MHPALPKTGDDMSGRPGRAQGFGDDWGRPPLPGVGIAEEVDFCLFPWLVQKETRRKMSFFQEKILSASHGPASRTTRQ